MEKRPGRDGGQHDPGQRNQPPGVIGREKPPLPPDPHGQQAQEIEGAPLAHRTPSGHGRYHSQLNLLVKNKTLDTIQNDSI